MSTYKARQVRKMLRSKLKCTIDEKPHHTYYLVFDGDRLVGETYMSRNNQDIDDYLQDRMAKQLGVPNNLFRSLVDCPANRSDYMAHIDSDTMQ